MSIRTSISRVVYAAFLVATASTALTAATMFKFTDSGPGYSASGHLVAIDNLDGSFTAVSGTGLFNGGLITLIPGSGLSPSGRFLYDNLLIPGADPELTGAGLLFNYLGQELNIFSVSAGVPYGTAVYSPTVPHWPLGDVNSQFTLTAVPEPASWSVLGTGLFLIAIHRRRRNPRA